MAEIVEEINRYLKRLFPICRSITGPGNRESLRILQEIVSLEIKEYTSGTLVYDWVIPDEWIVRDAWIKATNGSKLVDFQSCNIHLVGYSKPIHQKMSFDELKDHLHYRNDLPEAIPYRTTYYKRNWGFCVTKTQYEMLEQVKELAQEKFDPYEEVYLESEDDVIKREYGSRYFKFYKMISEMLTPNEKRYETGSNKSFKINDDLTLLTQTPNSAVFKFEKDVTSGSLFFSDNWYPGWVAYVNGKRVPLYVANYSFKGILLNFPKSSVVEFVFNPPITKIGNIISIMAFLCMVMLLCMRKNYHPILSKVKSKV